MHPSVAAMWQAYLAWQSPSAGVARRPLSFWHFCDNEQDADECVHLVLSGRNRATSPSLWFFASQSVPLPQVGDLHVVTNWEGEAQCVIRTTRVEIMAFDQVSEAHALAEDEGDGTLEWWRRVHWAYYHRELEESGFQPCSDMPIVCEYFECVYPLPA